MNSNRLYQLVALGMIATGTTAAVFARRMPLAPVAPAAPPIRNESAVDRGCRDGGVHGRNRTNPEWVSIEPADTPKILEGTVMESIVATNEFPFNHQFHDSNVLVKPFPEYEGLLSDKPELSGSTKVIECEWERPYFPEEFWPSPGDTLWTLGRFAFDCGHPDHDNVPGLSYHTEIHPPKAMAFSRTVAHTFAGDSAPSTVTRTVMYFHAQGGYFYDPIGGQDYTFRVALPPKPSPTAELKFEVISVPLGNIRPTMRLETLADRITATGGLNGGMIGGVREIKPLKPRLPPIDKNGSGDTRPPRPPRPTPAPTPKPAPSGGSLIVTFPLKGFRDPSPSRWNLYSNSLSARPKNEMPRFAAVIVAGWREPALTTGYRTLKVTLDNFRVNDDHDSFLKGDGEWFIWIQVNGNWQKLGGPGDILKGDGDTYKINPQTDKQTFLITVPEAGKISLGTTGYEQDSIDNLFGYATPGSEGVTDIPDLLDTNNGLGQVIRSFGASQNFGVGNHDDRSDSGDFNLRYHIEEVARFSSGQVNTHR